MKKNTFIFWLLILLLPFYCQKENSTEPEPGNGSHPQVDIPWPSLADSPWPMHHHDPQSTGRSPYSGPQLGKVAWKLKVGGPISTSVVIGPDSTIYFATSYDTSEKSQRSYLYALDWNGNLKWKYKLGHNNIQDCAPLIGADGTIYIGTMNSYLLAVHPNGQLKWSFETDAGIRQLGMNIGMDGVLYFVDLNHSLYAVDQNGVLKWKNSGNYYFTNSEQSGIAISPDGETLYLGCLGTAQSDTMRGLIAVAKNGQVKWLFKTGSLFGSPAIDNSGNIFFSPGFYTMDMTILVFFQSILKVNYAGATTLRLLTVGTLR